MYRRLSKPLTELKSSYEVVVIGSGYGGGIAASRLSRAKMEVCLLEKGKEFTPGEFPKNLVQASREMQFNKGDFEMGSENGLYDFVIGDEISVFKGCGLGGTSLVNANVSIEADPRVFEDEKWPKEILKNLDSVKDGIQHARDMLLPNPYPEGQNGYPVLDKTEAMRKSAKDMDKDFRLLDINVTFESKTNHVGVEQANCTNCGDCVTGCNRGAKNTVAMNYLPDAFNHGASIFTEVGVDHIEKSDDGWIVYITPYHTGREKFDSPHLFVRAKTVIISAGSLGSTEILLRSAKNGLNISNMIGKHFSGNGDVLGFGYNTDQPIHGIGRPNAAFDDKIANVGPCITSVIDTRNDGKLEDGMTIEEGSIPGPIKSILVPTFITFSRLIGKDTDSGFKDYLQEKWRELVSFFRGPYHGAVDNSQIYLVMSNDDGDGEMELKNDELIIKWKDVGKQKLFQRVNNNLLDATKALGGNFIKNPTWTKMLDYDLVTVHPLGGCAMGDDASKGVVDHKGQVFDGTDGKKLHRGLFVMDGAILPRPVGTNPLLTISGISERNVALIAKEHGKKFTYEFGDVSHNGHESTVGVQFTETMKGYIGIGEKEDFEKGHDKGKKDDSPFEFTLTIRSEDVDTFVKDKDHEAAMIGTMLVPKISNGPLMATDGVFNLFVDSEGGHKKMLYSAKLTDQDGNEYYFEGFKDVFDDKGLDLWQDTTTLFITLYEGLDPKGKILGKGKLIIELGDFLKQMTTMKAINSDSLKESLSAQTKFGKYFAGKIFDTYVKN